ncbi:hypothetical protein MANES_18G146100v8 [Manihot esculenta]|uniref:Uncharacterized protein n=1 Tax=Manihot esculenta TaxID=3983 RepID=A0A2C9U3E9_MANES|nr:hypothetical protein MANES_18G146100v8 [Manihot esculenta]
MVAILRVVAGAIKPNGSWFLLLPIPMMSRGFVVGVARLPCISAVSGLLSSSSDASSRFLVTGESRCASGDHAYLRNLIYDGALDADSDRRRECNRCASLGSPGWRWRASWSGQLLWRG